MQPLAWHFCNLMPRDEPAAQENSLRRLDMSEPIGMAQLPIGV